MAQTSHFININDEYRHLAGDAVLRELTDVLSKHIRHYDLLGRYGGEEYIIFSGDTTKSQLAMSMTGILEAVRRKTFRYNGIEMRFTFSGGLADCAEFDRERRWRRKRS